MAYVLPTPGHLPTNTLSRPRFFAASSRWIEIDGASGVGRPPSLTEFIVTNRPPTPALATGRPDRKETLKRLMKKPPPVSRPRHNQHGARRSSNHPRRRVAS